MMKTRVIDVPRDCHPVSAGADGFCTLSPGRDGLQRVRFRILRNSSWSAGRSGQADAELVDSVSDLIPVETQQLARSCLVSLDPFERLHEQLALDFFDRDTLRGQTEGRRSKCGDRR